MEGVVTTTWSPRPHPNPTRQALAGGAQGFGGLYQQLEHGLILSYLNEPSLFTKGLDHLG